MATTGTSYSDIMPLNQSDRYEKSFEKTIVKMNKYSRPRQVESEYTSCVDKNWDLFQQNNVY